MKLKLLVMPALIVALLAVLGDSASCAQEWQEQRITTTTWRETGPKMWGSTIYYNDFRSGAADVYRYNEASGSTPVIQASGTQLVDAVYEDRMVYRSYTQEAEGFADLYFLDPVQGTCAISTAAGDQRNADMYGDTVVYEDYSTGVSQIRIWDPVNGDRALSPTNSTQRGCQIWGQSVVWQDARNGRWDVYMWNPTDGERKLSTYIYPMLKPAIYQDRVLMWAPYNMDYDYGDAGLWEWTPAGGLRLLLPGSPISAPGYFDFWGDLVVWSGSANSNVTAWDPVNDYMSVNQSARGYAGAVSIYQNKVVWVGNYDIYLSTLVPEPSSLAALGGGCALLMMLRRKRR